MIARLAGTLLEKYPGRIVVDVGGVGYDVFVPLSTYYGIGEVGSPVTLQIHTHVREESLALFGFRTRREKDLFTRLIGVSGVGPKTAVAILSGLETEDLLAAVRGRDAARLASVPGIGRKTAERIILDLADRLDTLEPAPGAAAPAGAAGLRDDLVSALVNLGYNARVAGEATGRVLKNRSSVQAPTFEGLLRETLQVLSR
ncbi:MAG TPA: Holliday junction branch migration protein RuvA [Candidatus Polarisedimenticolia bacterium]